jgi:4-alpha-glucanotransferase
MSTDSWGIDDGYEDALGRWHTTPEATRSALLAAMGLDADGTRPPAGASVRVLRPGRAMPLQRPAELKLEDGTILRVDTALPTDLPLGYHELLPLDGGGASVDLIVSPGQCYLPADRILWGWSAQLYALRSRESWGIGDLADLRRLARWSSQVVGADACVWQDLLATDVVEATEAEGRRLTGEP